MNITLDKTSAVECDECHKNVFTQGQFMRRVSKFLLGSDKDQYTAIPIPYCVNCGYVNREFIPQELINLKDVEVKSTIIN